MRENEQKFLEKKRISQEKLVHFPLLLSFNYTVFNGMEKQPILSFLDKHVFNVKKNENEDILFLKISTLEGNRWRC